MATLGVTLEEEIAETAHWSADPPPQIEDQEFDLLAFELWHLGSNFELEPHVVDDWEDEHSTVAERASCL